MTSYIFSWLCFISREISRAHLPKKFDNVEVPKVGSSFLYLLIHTKYHMTFHWLCVNNYQGMAIEIELQTRVGIYQVEL